MTHAQLSTWGHVFHSTIGASHVRSGTPNQDAVRLIREEPGDVARGFALSDGHGSSKAFRSQTGSRFAVEVGAEFCQELLRESRDEVALQHAATEWADRVASRVVRAWRDKVGVDLALSPPTVAELERLSTTHPRAEIEKLLASPYSIYGATLLVALVLGDYLLMAQLGDGDILLVEDDGTVSEPIPSDARNFANATTSLSLPDAEASFRTAIRSPEASPPALVIASTDGWRNSFADDEGFLQVGPDILSDARQHGLEDMREKLESWLGHATVSGSGDDISLAMLIRGDLLARARLANLPTVEVQR